jgi:hypothetical protein
MELPVHHQDVGLLVGAEEEEDHPEIHLHPEVRVVVVLQGDREFL